MPFLALPARPVTAVADAAALRAGTSTELGVGQFASLTVLRKLYSWDPTSFGVDDGTSTSAYIRPTSVSALSAGRWCVHGDTAATPNTYGLRDGSGNLAVVALAASALFAASLNATSPGPGALAIGAGASTNAVSIGQAGITTTIAGTVVFSGTTVTVNSTVVTVADRVVQLNFSAGASDPVPTLICGIGIHRGAVASVDRDHAAWVWDETATSWVAAWNTGGDDATLGADLAVRGSVLYATTRVKTVELDSDGLGDVTLKRNGSTLITLASGQVVVPVGTVAFPGVSSPGVAFAGATTTGFAYSSGFSAIGVVVGATLVAAFAGRGLTLMPAAQTSGSPNALSIQTPAHTTLANAEASHITTSFSGHPTQFTGGATITNMRCVFLGIPDYRMASAGTITSAATLAIGGAPTSGDASVTFTLGPWALWVQGGASKFEGQLGASAGSVSAPGLVTYSDLDTGLYWPTANNLAISCNGVQVVSFTKTACTWTQTASTSQAAIGFTWLGGAHVTLPPSAENVDVRFDFGRTVQWQTGDFATQRHFLIIAPTLAFSGASTISSAATFAVTGPPIEGTNATITKGYSIWSQSGVVRVDGELDVTGELAASGAARFTGSTFGVFGATPAAQQVSGANLTNNVTSGGSDDVVGNWTDLTTYATDAAAIRNGVYQLARKVKQLNDGLRLLGLFT